MKALKANFLLLASALLLSACLGIEDSDFSDSTTSSALPSPTGLTAAVDGTRVDLSWRAVDGATSYKIYRGSGELQSVDVTSFSDSGLSAGDYSYAVSAVNSSGESAQTGVVISIIEQLSGEDPLQTYQWHLDNTGQSAFASDSGGFDEDISHSTAIARGWSGEGVRVNVIDTGLELQHPDLQANIIAGGSHDYLDGDDDPTNTISTSGDHGTSVAGLIAAVGDNGIGVSGVAPNALLQGFNYLNSSPQTTSGYVLAHGFDDKLEATAIFNKSLGAIYTRDVRWIQLC